MNKLIFKSATFLLVCFLGACSPRTDYTVTSPDGQISVSLKFDKEKGILNYSVQSRGTEIISSSPIGINTDKADFRSGMKLKKQTSKTIDETYTLPQGKVSNYQNKASEQTLTFNKDEEELNVHFRVYNDGVAFSFEIPGKGNIEFYGESSAINLAGENFTYWGQNHPNKYGYESALGPIDGKMMSNPVLAELKDSKHFVLMGQAATYGNYIQAHFTRSGSTFTYCYPLDQEKIGPVITSLPFQSPWRMVIISPENPGKIVESYLMENLNPPTKPEFLNADGTFKDWIRPGNVMWDFIAKDGDKPRM